MRAARGLPLPGAALFLGAALSVSALWGAATGSQADLAVYRLGGQAILSGGPLYDQAVPSTGLPFTYTPFAAALFAPLAPLPQPAAQVAWVALTLVALSCFVAVALEYAAPGLARRVGRLGALAVAGPVLLLEPVRHNLGLGQVNILLALAVLLDLRRRTGRLPGGALVGVAAAVKLTPLVFAGYLALARRPRDAAVAFATFGGCLGLGWLVAPAASHEYWTKLIFDSQRVGGVAYVSNQSLYGGFSRLAGGPAHVGQSYRLTEVLAAVAGIALAVYARRVGRLLFGDVLCACTGLLISPISWCHHWVWAVPALLWLAVAADAPRWGRRAAAGGFLLFALGPIWWVPNTRGREYAHHGWQLLAANAYLLAAVAFLVAAGVHLLRTRWRPATGRLHPTDGEPMGGVVAHAATSPTAPAHHRG